MTATQNEEVKKRLDEIHRLEKVIEDAHVRLAKLMGVPQEEEIKKRSSTLPSGRNLSIEIRKALEKKGRPLTPKEVKKEIDKTYDVDINRANIQATMTYMSKKGELVSVAKEFGHGKFKLAITESP